MALLFPSSNAGNLDGHPPLPPPTYILRTVNSMDSHLLEPKDANTEPLSRANALANPIFQEANTQNAPEEAPTVHDQTPDAAISPRR
jgi:hypothetical protein